MPAIHKFIEVENDNGDFDEIELLVHFDYQPEEPKILNPPDHADPGCREACFITEVEEIGTGNKWSSDKWLLHFDDADILRDYKDY